MGTNRREFLKIAGAGAATLATSRQLWGTIHDTGRKKPNVIFILADDLGYGDLGCYGQQKIKTPNIDRLAVEGMRFTDHYAGSPVCAPSRCSLLTGKHMGHAYIRDNDEFAPPGIDDVFKHPEIEGQRPLLAGTHTLGTLFQQAGYKTACIGKWGLGGPGTDGEPNKQGFDHFFGYLCQRQAHNYYPDHLWRDGKRVNLDNAVKVHQKLPTDKDPNDPKSYAPYQGKQYSFDLMMDDAADFIRSNQRRRFFLYLTPTIPHVSLQVPEDSLAEYEKSFPETPYKGEGGYVPNRTPRAAFAAMVTRLDRGVGRIMSLLKELKLDKDTLVVFTSDNGPTTEGGSDPAFFRSSGGLRGGKRQVYEGGIRIPLVARWPVAIAAGSTSSHASAFWDFTPTFAEVAGAPVPADTDGISMVAALEGKPKAQRKHEYLYWEFAGRQQAVRWENWKGVRSRPTAPVELYDLSRDEAEKIDVAKDHPDVVAKIEQFMAAAHVPSSIFPLVNERRDSAERQ